MLISEALALLKLSVGAAHPRAYLDAAAAEGRPAGLALLRWRERVLKPAYATRLAELQAAKPTQDSAQNLGRWKATAISEAYELLAAVDARRLVRD